MSRLDIALLALADRGDPLGADGMLDRLDRELTGETAPVVVTLDTRRSAMETLTRETIEGPKAWWKSSRVLVGLGSAVLVVAVIGAIVVLNSDDGFDSADASAVSDSYFAAYNAGDVGAVLALLGADGTFEDNFGPVTRPEWEQLLAWNTAQGTILSPADCQVTDEIPGVSVTLACPHTNLDALVQAVDGPPVPIDLRLTITPDGISEWTSYFGSPDFTAVGHPFDRWMEANHPEDVDSVGFGNWTSVTEAEQNGILTAKYADEWGADLQERGCDYRLLSC